MLLFENVFGAPLPMFLFIFIVVSGLLLCLSGAKTISVESAAKSGIVKKDYQQLINSVPQAAADYCIDLWKIYDFTFNFKGNRKTKLGDFRIDRTGKKVSISVNGTLNPYAFLLTYIHEVAHLTTWRQHGRAIKPHGAEWQAQFRLLMLPLLTQEVFPAEILRPLQKYMQAPAASTASCQPLWIALRSFDQHEAENALYLGQLANGDKFVFSATVYQKVEMRRTRALCQNLSNGRRYLISTVAKVELVA